MKPGTLSRISAGALFVVGAVNGVAALESHNEAIRAETIAITLVDQDDPRAPEWQLYADQQESKRNFLLTASVLLLGGSVLKVSALLAPRLEKESQDT